MKVSVDSPLLPCPLIKEARGLNLDPDNTEDGARAVVPPYGAMSAGDIVTFYWLELTGTTGRHDYTNARELQESDIGKPVIWTIPWRNIWPLEDGQAEIHYTIAYRDKNRSTQGSTSAEQIIAINKVAPVLLDPVSFDNYQGGEVSPGLYPEGLFISAPFWPEADRETVMTVYIESSTSNKKIVLVQHLDVSNLDSQKVTVQFTQSDLYNFINETINISCQYSKTGASASSQSRELDIVPPLYLPVPAFSTEYVTPDNPGASSGWANALELADGLPVSIPADAETGGHSIIMCCEGDVPAQSFTLPASSETEFVFPATMVAACMGHGSNIFYRLVTPEGGMLGESDPFRLTIKKIPSRQFPPASCQYVNEQVLSVRDIITETVKVTLDYWGFMDTGQLVTITLSGTAPGEKTVNEIILDGHAVTDSEKGNKVVAHVNISVFQSLQPYTQFSLISRVSFDKGDSFIPFPDTRLTIEP